MCTQGGSGTGATMRVKALGGGVPGHSGVEGLLRVLLKCERSQRTTNDAVLTKLYLPNPEPQSHMPCDGHHGRHDTVETACSRTVHCAVQLVLQILTATAAVTIRRHRTTVGIQRGAHPYIKHWGKCFASFNGWISLQLCTSILSSEACYQGAMRPGDICLIC